MKRRNRPGKEISVKDFLEWLDKEFQARQNNPNPPYPFKQDTDTIELPEKIKQELIKLLKDGKKIEAVKRVTELTGAGLRVSKDYVDDLYQI